MGTGLALPQARVPPTMPQRTTWPCLLQRSPVDARDWQYHIVRAPPAGAEADPPPGAVDWTPRLQHVRDQGDEGACAAFAGAALKEVHECMDTGQARPIALSPRFVYSLRANRPQEGMHLRDLMRILRDAGICLEDACPYRPGAPLEPDALGDAARAQAAGYRVRAYAQVLTLEDAKRALAEQGPLVAALPVFNFGPAFWRPETPEQPLLGGHAVAVVGYSDTRRAFRLRNSWGRGWNRSGHTHFPYADWGLQWELWTAVDERGSPPPPPPADGDADGGARCGCFG